MLGIHTKVHILSPFTYLPAIFYIVPGAAPQDTEVLTASSTSILVQWNPPEDIFLNGVLRGYRIQYTPSNGLQAPQYQDVSYGNTSVLLEGLEEFTNYSINVAAVTIGVGVYSDVLFTITYQDSTCVWQAIATVKITYNNKV